MNGKVLKVVEYNLSFGENTRKINVYGLFRYKKNNNLYIIYSDTNLQYNYISYGSSHIKEGSVLSMAITHPEDEEIIKEYVYKVVHQQKLDNFEIISLETINGIELISANKLAVDPNVLKQLADLTLPKEKEETKTEPQEEQPKKRSFKVLFFPLLLVIIGLGIYFFLATPKKSTGSIKVFTCTKTYQHTTLNASVEEKNTYQFSLQEQLQKVTEKKTYHFKEEKDYQDFIQKGTIYKYIPDEDEGTFQKNDQAFTLTTTTYQEVNISYNQPTNYEEALSFQQKEGYTCEERLEENE